MCFGRRASAGCNSVAYQGDFRWFGHAHLLDRSKRTCSFSESSPAPPAMVMSRDGCRSSDRKVDRGVVIKSLAASMIVGPLSQIAEATAVDGGSESEDLETAYPVSDVEIPADVGNNARWIWCAFDCHVPALFISEHDHCLEAERLTPPLAGSVCDPEPSRGGHCHSRQKTSSTQGLFLFFS